MSNNKVENFLAPKLVNAGALAARRPHVGFGSGQRLVPRTVTATVAAPRRRLDPVHRRRRQPDALPRQLPHRRRWRAPRDRHGRASATSSPSTCPSTRPRPPFRPPSILVASRRPTARGTRGTTGGSRGITGNDGVGAPGPSRRSPTARPGQDHRPEDHQRFVVATAQPVAGGHHERDRWDQRRRHDHGHGIRARRRREQPA